MNYKFKYKNSAKNDFAVNLLLILISAVLAFMGAKFFGSRSSIVVYALSIAVSYCKIAVEAIERLIGGKLDVSLISTVAILIIFASQNFLAAAAVAVVYSLCKVVFDFICSLFSDRLIEEDENKLKYEVYLDNSETKTVYAEDLEENDIVKVKKGEYLGFDYIFKNEKGEEKTFKSGKFNSADEAYVKVVQQWPYEIDFSDCYCNEKSKAEKITAIVTNIYTLAAVVIALAMFAMKIIDGESFFDSLYTFGVFLLFANPLSIDSGVLHAGLFSLKDLKEKGINLKSAYEVEKLSRVKKVFFTNDTALEDENTVNISAVKAVKIADVLNVDVELLSDKDEKNTEILATSVGFNQYQALVDDEKTRSIIAEQVIKGDVAYVSEKKQEDTKMVISLSTDCKEKNSVCKKSLGNLMIAVKTTKFYKLFAYLRVAIGVVVNFAVLAFYAIGIGDRIFSNMLIEEVTASAEETSLTAKLLECLVYNNTVAPWLIGLVHIVVINVFLFITLGFLNNNKKLR